MTNSNRGFFYTRFLNNLIRQFPLSVSDINNTLPSLNGILTPFSENFRRYLCFDISIVLRESTDIKPVYISSVLTYSTGLFLITRTSPFYKSFSDFLCKKHKSLIEGNLYSSFFKKQKDGIPPPPYP